MPLPASTIVKPASAPQPCARTKERPKEHEYDLFLLAALRHLAEPTLIDYERALLPPSQRRLRAA